MTDKLTPRHATSPARIAGAGTPIAVLAMTAVGFALQAYCEHRPGAFTLGRAYEALGRPDPARRAYELAPLQRLDVSRRVWGTTGQIGGTVLISSAALLPRSFV